MAFELKRNDDDKKNINYSDYFIEYYFNDELVWNMTVNKFLNIMEPHVMSSEQLNAVCNLSSNKNENSNNNTSGNETINNNGNNNQTEENVKYNTVKDEENRTALVIVFALLFGVSLVINVITIYKLLSKNKNKNLGEKQNIESSIANMQNNKNNEYIKN